MATTTTMIKSLGRMSARPRLRFISSSSAAAPTRATSLPAPVPDLQDCLEDPDFVRQNLLDRKYPLEGTVVDQIQTWERESVRLREEIRTVRERRNVISRIRSGKGTAGTEQQDGGAANDEAASIKRSLKDLEPRLALLSRQLSQLVLQLPNTSHPSSPIGAESAARIVKTLGPSISPSATPEPSRDHLRLTSPAQLGWTDFPSASLVSGASWPYLLKEGALLEMALTNYAFSIAIARGFTPVLTPDVIRSEIADRCGFRPREGEAQQTYFLGNGGAASSKDVIEGNQLVLAGTAEIPLVAMNAATVLSHAALPLKHVALGRAFRAEAGARGADSRGLYRVHQFSKVEMVVVCREEESDRILEELRGVQEEILGSLGLSLRVLDMPTQELGASAHRKYDIEAWMPGRGKWGELSSASNCTTYQSRRLSIRYRPSTSSRAPFEDLDIPTPAALEATALFPSTFSSSSSASGAQGKLLFAHTLNATAAAIPRLIIAILENGAVLEGEEYVVTRVRLPNVLKQFWIGDRDSKRIEWVAEGEALRI